MQGSGRQGWLALHTARFPATTKYKERTKKPGVSENTAEHAACQSSGEHGQLGWWRFPLTWMGGRESARCMSDERRRTRRRTKALTPPHTEAMDADRPSGCVPQPSLSGLVLGRRPAAVTTAAARELRIRRSRGRMTKLWSQRTECASPRAPQRDDDHGDGRPPSSWSMLCCATPR